MDWNAEQYHKLSEPQFEWGLHVLARLATLPLRGDETVLDAGCGTGRLTLQLASLFPRGRVIATDLSAPMLRNFAKTLRSNGNRPDHAKETSPALSDSPFPMPHPPISLVLSDFQSLPFRRAFDIIFSTAAFHWAPDHDALFASIFHALRPGGRVVAQCGGGANLARIREREQILMHNPRFARFFRPWRAPWNYADVPTTKQRLVDIGFADAEVWLENAPVTMADAIVYRNFAETVIERTQIALIPDPHLRDQYLDEFVRLADDDFTFDYVRLNINAQRF
jgi:trans-aconitate 2-methyltransferase